MEDNYWRSFTGKQEGVPVPISWEMLWMMGRAGKKNSNNRDFQFWQQNNDPIELNTNGLLSNPLHYTHYNTVEAGFVPMGSLRDEPTEGLDLQQCKGLCRRESIVKNYFA